jgi:hypothetical protein
MDAAANFRNSLFRFGLISFDLSFPLAEITQYP